MSKKAGEKDQEETGPAPDAEIIDAAEEGAAEEGAGEAGEAAPKLSPEEEAAALRDEVADLRDKLLRSVAEQENFRKRSERERDQTRKYAVAGLAGDLLSVADNLRRALESAPQDRAGLDEALTNLLVGVEMTERDLLAAFEGNGVRRIDPMGEAFDYNLHQAMFEVEDGDQAPGTVVQVLQPGYVLGDRVLRAAMVGVAKATPEEPGAADT